VEGLPAPGVNIDHHITNPGFAELNLVEPEAVATAAILAKYLPDWELVITPPVAGALLTGIVTDTIGFRTSNMNPEALRLSAELMERGASLPDLYHQSLIKRSFPAARYWGEGLHKLQQKNRLVWTSLSLEDREAAGYTGNDDADLVNVLSSIDDADVAVIFVQQRGGEVKVSWRSQAGLDVSQIAIQFGGGGHAAAAGTEIEGTLEEVESQVLKATEAAMMPLRSLQVE
jgi:phosphoesterase RecJ-like protein